MELRGLGMGNSTLFDYDGAVMWTSDVRAGRDCERCDCFSDRSECGHWEVEIGRKPEEGMY